MVSEINDLEKNAAAFPHVQRFYIESTLSSALHAMSTKKVVMFTLFAAPQLI